jgi:hypothetical protein
MAPTFITFRPRPADTSAEAMAAFLGVFARAGLARSSARDTSSLQARFNGMLGRLARGLLPGFIGPSPALGLELLSTGGRLRLGLVTSDSTQVDLLIHALQAWHPGADISCSDVDPLPRRTASYALAEITTTADRRLPIGDTRGNQEPLTALIGAFGQLAPAEIALFQIVVRPMRAATWARRHTGSPRGLPEGADRVITERGHEPGFEAQMRLLLLAPTSGAAQHRLTACLAALAPFDGSWSRFRPARRPLDPLVVRRAIHERKFRRFGPTVWLTARELACLYHVPLVAPGAAAQVEHAADGGLPPLPRRLPTSGLYLGTSTRAGRPIYLPQASRVRHTLLLGPTGSGKTHALASFVLQDLSEGRGCSLLTPSPDAIRRIVRRAPSDRLDDIVLVRFDAPGWTFGLNPLAQEGADSWRVASELVAIWERLYPQFWGPLVSDIFKHGVLALSERGDSSLLELVDLLEDPERRRRQLEQIRDPLVRRYWERFDDLSLSGQETRARSSLNKIRAPLIIPWLRRTLASPNALSLRRVLDERKVVLWDLSNLADEGRLLGALIVSQYFQAALGRAALPEERRVSHILYADEWQSWPTTAWSKGLDLLRQFGVGLVLAGQRLDQVSEELRSAALANVGSALIWGLRSDADAATMARWLATPGLESESIKRLGRFRAYARLLVNGAPLPAFSLDLPELPPEVADPRKREQLLWERSRARYYRAADLVDRAIERRYDDAVQDPQSRRRRRTRPHAGGTDRSRR